MKTAVWFHGLFSHGSPREVRPQALAIVQHCMKCLTDSGLAAAADEIWTCFNGSNEEENYARVLVPPKANIVMHGLNSFAENLTVCRLHEWSKAHQDFNVLYYHSKGATHEPGSSYGDNVAGPWRDAMLADLVDNWRHCVSQLDAGADVVCSRWLWNMGWDLSQHIPAGNFLWTTSRFVASLPSMYARDRIKVSGIGAADSRYESEVFWGNGRRPTVFQYRPNGGGGVP